MQDWRYCGSRGQKPEIKTGQAYRVSMGRDGVESRMSIDDQWKSKGKEAGRELTALRLAVYGYDAQFDVDDMVVRGVLTADYVEKNHLDLLGFKPPADVIVPKTAEPTPLDPVVAERVRAQIAGYPLDTKHPAMAALLRDPKVPVVLRDEAAEHVKANGGKKIVPFLADGLYSDDLDARRIAIETIKALVGKDFGYRPTAPEDSRKKAAQSFNEYLQKKAEDFR